MLYNQTEGEAWTSRLFLPERSGTRGCCPGMQESSAPEYQVIIVNHIALDNMSFIIRALEGVGRKGTSAVRKNCKLCIIEHSLPGI